MGCEAVLKQATLIVSDAPYASVLLPVSGSSRTSPLLRLGRLWTSGASHDPNTPGQNQHSFCPEGVGADLSAMGCEAVLKQATLIVSDAPY
ncbi:hypothetical protein RA272_28270, partial [Pseudomonas syringae pv. tagetis]